VQELQIAKAKPQDTSRNCKQALKWPNTQKPRGKNHQENRLKNHQEAEVEPG
jgi:hypothetical protein